MRLKNRCRSVPKIGADPDQMEKKRKFDRAVKMGLKTW